MTGVFDFIENYLIRDLKSMRAIESKDGLGKCGYQMIMSLCSACEMLGSVEKNEFKKKGGGLRFRFFLEKHLPEYVASTDILYSFIRHRVAHDFITPPGIAIRLDDDRSRHLGLMDDYFIVDAYVFMDDFISAYEQLKKRYIKEPAYKELLDNGYKLLVQFMSKEKEELDNKISKSQFKDLEYPTEKDINNENINIPSGAAFEFDKENFTRIPDDMLEKMNLKFEKTAVSGASGSKIKDKDIKSLKK